MRPLLLLTLATLALSPVAHAQQSQPTTPSISIAGLDPQNPRRGEELFFDVIDVSFGAESRVSVSAATGGAGAGKAQFTELSFTHSADPISHDLLFYCVSGKPIATITVRLGNEVTATLSNAFITSYKISQATGTASRVPLEKVTVAFSKVRFEKVITDTSGAKKTLVFMEWDVSKNIGSSSTPKK